MSLHRVNVRCKGGYFQTAKKSRGEERFKNKNVCETEKRKDFLHIKELYV